jgi:Putative Ig domain
MKRAIAAAIALSFAACGGPSDTPAPAPPGRGGPEAAATNGDNEEPTIDSVAIEPDPASAADTLSLAVVARDSEHDRLKTTIEWYKNGELVPDLRDSVVEAGTFSRGDRVYAMVYVADATHEVSRQTSAISIGNSVPRIHALFVDPAQPTALDLLEAAPNVSDADGDSVELSYRWYKNGQLIPAATSSRLPAGIAHRGDKVFVEASASDGTDTGPWVASQAVELANAKPAITTQPGYEMGPNGVYSYDIGAKDPDGDEPLRYELVQGPKGMTVDESTGAVTWTVPQDANGNHPVEVAVSDPHGGRTTQHWVLSVDWNQAPASASPEQPANGARAKETEDEEAPAKRSVAKPKDTKTTKAAKAKPASEDDTESDQDQGEAPEEEEF